jgi:AcrR family transcriptional regulator
MTKPIGQGRDVDSEQRILDAAHAVFTRSGTAGARMQEVADEAGVNKALLHYYFRSKDRLAEAVFRRAAAGVFPAVLQVLGSNLEIEEKVERVVAHYLTQLSQAPYLAGYVISELNQHPERITQYLRAVATAATRPNDDDAPATSRANAAKTAFHSKVLAVLDKQLRARARAGTLRPISVDQFLVNLLAVCIFPFAARPILEAMLGLEDAAFRRFIAHRRKELPAFFLRALQP